MRGWKPLDSAVFKEQLDARLIAQNIPCDTNNISTNLQAKCQEIESILADVARNCPAEECSMKEDITDAMRRLHELIDQRRAVRTAGAKEEVRIASKYIENEIVAITRTKKSSRVRKVLEEFKDFQRIAEIRSNGKRSCISSIIDRSGTVRTTRTEIPEVFADFFESLYQGEGATSDACWQGDEII